MLNFTSYPYSSHNTDMIKFPSWAILKELIFIFALAAGLIFSSNRTVDARWVYIIQFMPDRAGQC